MNKIITEIDQGIKELYNLSDLDKVDSFVMESDHTVAPGQGGFLVYENKELPHSPEEPSTEVGVYFHPNLVGSLPGDIRSVKNVEQLQALSVAMEEISHFNYFLFHGGRGRQLSKLEMEVQAEVDRYLLFYFSYLGSYPCKKELFSYWYERLFSAFQLADHLNSEEKERYLEANHQAKHWVQKLRPLLTQSTFEDLFSVLRQFYRLSHADKISLIHSR